MHAEANSANIVQPLTIDTVRLVNSVFKQHQMAEQMGAQHWTYQRGFYFFIPPSQHLPPLLLYLFPSPSPSSLHLSLLLSCLCFGCRSEVSSMCCIHFQFPFCGGIPLVIMLPFPTLALCAWIEQPKIWFLGTQRSNSLTFSVTVRHWQKCDFFYFGPWPSSVIHGWKYHVSIKMKMTRLVVCLELHTHT